MADTLTSIKTTGGWADAAVASVAYDLYFKWNLRTFPICRSYADVRPQDVRHNGTAYRLTLNTDFDEASVTSAQTPLDEETDVSATQLPTPTYVDLTPKEYGFGVVRTLKLNNRGLVPIDPVIANAVAYHQARTVDGLVQAKLSAGTNTWWGNSSHTTDNTTVAGDEITGQVVRRIVAKFREKGVAPRDGQFYAGLVHPHTSLSLRAKTGSGEWRNPQEYGVNQSRIWAGEIGEFEGVRFVENPRLIKKANTVPNQIYKSYFMGKEALAEAVNVEPGIRIAPTVDRLSRKYGIGWYMDADWAVYRQDALAVLTTALSAADATAMA